MTTELQVSANGHASSSPPALIARPHSIERLYYRTTCGPEFIDITEDVRGIVDRSGLRDGFAVVFSRHTTAAIRINENEPLLIDDMKAMLARFAPSGIYYRHNDMTVRTENLTENEDLNGHSHCQHLLMGASETVPCVDGELLLGRWQRIFLVELDCGREREVVVQVLGT